MISITLPPFALVIPKWKLSKHKYELEVQYNDRGIYVLYGANNVVLYVGKSRRAYSRLRQHVNGMGTSSNFNSFITHIGFIYVEELAYLDIYESYAINTLMPEFNRDKVFYDAEIARQFEFELLMSEGYMNAYSDEVEELEELRHVSELARIDYGIATDNLRRYRSRVAYINGKLDEMGR